MLETQATAKTNYDQHWNVEMDQFRMSERVFSIYPNRSKEE